MLEEFVLNQKENQNSIFSIVLEILEEPKKKKSKKVAYVG